MAGSKLRTWLRAAFSGIDSRENIDAQIDTELLTPIADAASDISTLQTADAAAIHDDTAGEIAAVTEKASPVAGDLLLIEDSAAGNAKKSVQIGNLPTGSDAAAIHDDTAGEIAAVTEKVSPVSGDLLLIEDSAAANAKKRVQIGNLPGGVDSTAIHKATAAEISAMTEKTSPVSADLLVMEDSEAANAKKKVQIGSLVSATSSSDPFVNRSHVLWNNAYKHWDFLGDATAIDDWTPLEPLGDCGTWALQAEIGGAPRLYITDTTVGYYMNVGHNGLWSVTTAVRMAFRVARKAHAGTLAHRCQVMFQMSNAAAFDRNLCGFRADATGNWFALTANQVGETTVDTGITSSDNAFHWLEFEISGGTATFWIDGVQKATTSSTLPSGTYGQPVLRGEVLESSTGNQDKNWIDAVIIKQPRTTSAL